MRLIDADALIEELNNSHFPGAPYVDAGISIAIGKVLDASTIEPERPTGMWVTQEFGSWAECSECHELYDIPIAYSNFCPNCGSYNGGES